MGRGFARELDVGATRSPGDEAMESNRQADGEESPELRPAASYVGRHALRDQDALWAEFLAMALTVVESLAKSVEVLCERRLDAVPEVKNLERDSDQAEVRIEQECLRIFALFEPVASDLRRMATILKINRDWERIADLAVRVAQRARKLARTADSVAVPEQLKSMARDVLDQVHSSYEALAARDAIRARAVIDGDRVINKRYNQLRRELRESLRRQAELLDEWLRLMSIARNLERIGDHAVGIAQTIVYMEEGIIIRHKSIFKPPNE
jgi:phosphate transport system protein